MTLRLLGIAFRNLLRAKRRNALAGGSMALGAAALVIASGLADGISRQLSDNLVAVQTGHLQAVVRPDEFHPQNNPFDAYGQDRLPDAAALARRIEEEGRASGVRRAVPYLFVRGNAMAGSRSSVAWIVGIDPAREPELRAAQPPIAGSFLPENDDAAVYLAEVAARKLRVGVGDSVSFVVQTPQGAVNSLDAAVCGVFPKGAPWYDNAFYVTLGAAQALVDWPGGATNVKVLLEDASPRSIDRARRAVETAIVAARPTPLPKGTRVRVETYAEAGRFSWAIIQANQAALVMLSGFLFAAAGVGVVNAMLMSVRERTREIGTMRALGMRRARVVRLFVLEGLALGVMSALVGGAAGVAVVLSLAVKGLPMKAAALAWMAGGDRLYPALVPASLLRATLSIVALSTLAAVYPAFSASRLEPREALQHV
ncbi:MAG TPA: FtsX-like permease family protein [Vicinamibacteria bacterium]|nr:FtsX-like permease family protein [Vicinamibacteria bacterium]